MRFSLIKLVPGGGIKGPGKKSRVGELKEWGINGPKKNREPGELKDGGELFRLNRQLNEVNTFGEKNR